MPGPRTKVGSKMGNCNLCGEAIMWLDTRKSKRVAINADSGSPEDRVFDKNQGHICHWETCPQRENREDRESPQRPSTCKVCNKPIIWMTTFKGKNVPVDPESVEPQDEIFEKAKHKCHFDTCEQPF